MGQGGTGSSGGGFCSKPQPPRMHEKKEADGNDEQKWADEQPEIEVQVSGQLIKSPFHLAGLPGGRYGRLTAFMAGRVNTPTER